jgi:hypothetical protein
MRSKRPLSGETVALIGLGAAFASVALFMCVAAYKAGQSKVDAPRVAVASLSPWLPPALPPAAQIPDTQPDSDPVFAPAPAPTSGAPLPPLRPIDVNPPKASQTPLALAPRPNIADIGAKPSSLGQYDQFTAVYDLTAHTVYLPGGERLEAHSGLGALRDDPAHVDEADRGATPPHIYDLTLRESLFHGVQALRLNPLGGPQSIFGRAGLLAHTYMLGHGGDSNGCVSFKDYDAFLQAFQNGRVKRLAVVGSVK